MTGGRIYLPDGSCAPTEPLTAGPPGIPGKPFPADPNDFLRLELGVAASPGKGVTVETEVP